MQYLSFGSADFADGVDVELRVLLREFFGVGGDGVVVVGKARQCVADAAFGAEPVLRDADVEQHDVVHRVAAFDDAFDAEGFFAAVVLDEADAVAHFQLQLRGERLAEHGVAVVKGDADPATLHLPVGDERGQRREINANQRDRFAFAARYRIEVGAGCVVKLFRHGGDDGFVLFEGKRRFVFRAEVEVGAEGAQFAAHFFIDIKVHGGHGRYHRSADGKGGDDDQRAPPLEAQRLEKQ